MIDTDKYEGYTPAPWAYNTDDDGWTLVRREDEPEDEFIVLMTKTNGDPYLTMNPDLKLIADAPLLLAEVKRLRGLLKQVFELTVKEDLPYQGEYVRLLLEVRDITLKGGD